MKKLRGILEFVFGLGGIELGNRIIESDCYLGCFLIIECIILAFIGCVNIFSKQINK